MPNIPTFEAGIEGLTPSERGATAFREAAVTQIRTANVAAEATRRAGQTIGSGLQSLGSALGGIEEKAQAHTDAMAQLDFENGLTALEVANTGGLKNAYTPTSGQDGSPIEDHFGNGINKSLPPDANVPTPQSYTMVASALTDNHSTGIQGLIERATGMGVSRKQQDKMMIEGVRSQRRFLVQAAAGDAVTQVNHAIHSTETGLRLLMAGVERDTTTLDDAHQRIDAPIDALEQQLTGHIGAEATKTLETQRNAAHSLAITTAINREINKGTPEGDAKADAILNNPKWDKYIGGSRDTLRTAMEKAKVQAAATNERMETLQQKSDFRQMDSQLTQAWNTRKDGDPEPDWARTPLGTKYPHRVDVMHQMWEQHEKAALGREQPDPVVSFRNKEAILRDMVSGVNPDEALEKGRQAFISKNPAEKISEKDLGEIQKVYNDPAAKAFTKATNDWLYKGGGAGQIDKDYAEGKGLEAGGHSQLGLEQVQKWKEELQRRALADPAHARDLLDRSKPGNMVSPESLAPYRVTETMKSADVKNRTKLEQQADEARVRLGLEPPPEPSMARKVIDWVTGGAKAPAAPAVPGVAPAAAAPQAAPIKVPPNVTPQDILKDPATYPPKSQIILPNGDKWTVPEKMSYAPTNEPGTSAQNAIQSALQGTARGAVASLQKASLGPPADVGAPAAHTPSDAATGGGNAAPMGKATSGGAQASYAAATIMIESGGRTGQRTGSYEGLGQFSKAEQRRLGISDPDNRGQVTRALQREAEGFRPALTKALGHEPEPSDYYLAHQQGVGGAVAHLTHPDQPAYLSMAQTGEGRQKGIGWAKRAIWGNMSRGMRAEFPGGVETVTSGDFVEMWAARYNREVTRVAGR